MRRRDLIAALAGGAFALLLAGGAAWAAIAGPRRRDPGLLRRRRERQSRSGASMPEELHTVPVERAGPEGRAGTSRRKRDAGCESDGCTAPAWRLWVPGRRRRDHGRRWVESPPSATAPMGRTDNPSPGPLRVPNGQYAINVTDAGIILSSRSAHQLRARWRRSRAPQQGPLRSPERPDHLASSGGRPLSEGQSGGRQLADRTCKLLAL